MRRPALPIAVGLALASLSTLLPWALAFDPEAWLLWGRETLHLDLATAGGPSWKPLPVGIDLLLAPLGGAAPWAWLVLARAAGLAALAGAAALTWRLCGSRAAAATAAGLIALSPWWAFNTALGNSEGLLAAALLWAACAHLAGRPTLALALGVAAALLRPEVWPFLGLYALWQWRAHPEHRARVAPALAIIPLAWFVPELLASGRPFRAADAALGTPSSEAAANATHPWLEVLRDAVELTTVPVAFAFALALALGLRRLRGPGAPDPRARATVVIAASAVAWVALVSAMTAAGFAGTPRYSAPAAALAAVTAATLARRLVLALPLVVLVAALQAPDLDRRREDLGQRAALREQLESLVPAAARACRPVRTAATTTSTVAWHLDLPLEGLARAPASSDTDLRIVDGRWRLRPGCGRR